jgi:hypothetical protein
MCRSARGTYIEAAGLATGGFFRAANQPILLDAVARYHGGIHNTPIIEIIRMNPPHQGGRT